MSDYDDLKAAVVLADVAAAADADALERIRIAELGKGRITGLVKGRGTMP